ncbi:hypothetical protein Alg215_10119 [Pyrenophora tritici-repentis]|nr:hypothetical protein Alg215_10119 [Pyrenophora tritici-repentis]
MLDEYECHPVDPSEWMESISPVEIQDETEEDERYAFVSPLLDPSQCEEDSASNDESDIVEKGPANAVPPHLSPDDAFWTRMRLVQIRNLLVRCQILYTTVRCMERRPSKPPTDAQLDRYYKKIRYLGTRARKVAEAIGGDDLRARAEYWAGRGCGGLQDWQAAITHFTAAIKFDVPNFTDEKEELRQRGLLQEEKNDVEFLLQSVKQRERDLEQRKENAIREKYGDIHPNLHPPDINWALLKGPRWTPDRDRLVELAKTQYGSTRQSMSRFTITENGEEGYTKEEISFIYERMAMEDTSEFSRKLLSVEEWRYIVRGDEPGDGQDGSPQQQAQHSEPAAETNARLPDITLTTPTERSSSESSRQTSMESNDAHLKKPQSVSNPPLPSPPPLRLSKLENTSSPTSPRLTIKERRKKKVKSIVMPRGHTGVVASRALPKSAEPKDNKGTGDEESEGEIVDVRLDHTLDVEETIASIFERDAENAGNESGGSTPRVAGFEDESGESTPQVATESK